MHFTQVLISLSVLIACGPVGNGDITAPQQPSTATEESEQCSTCEFRQHSKLMRLHAIKSQILSKLRLKQAPNISRDVVKQLLPKAPPLQELLDQYDVLGDDSKDGAMEEDDEHATTETIMTMATERKDQLFQRFIHVNVATILLTDKESTWRDPLRNLYAQASCTHEAAIVHKMHKYDVYLIVYSYFLRLCASIFNLAKAILRTPNMEAQQKRTSVGQKKTLSPLPHVICEL